MSSNMIRNKGKVALKTDCLSKCYYNCVSSAALDNLISLLRFIYIVKHLSPFLDDVMMTMKLLYYDESK